MELNDGPAAVVADERQLVRTTLDALPLCVLVLDERLRLVMANRPLAQRCGGGATTVGQEGPRVAFSQRGLRVGCGVSEVLSAELLEQQNLRGRIRQVVLTGRRDELPQLAMKGEGGDERRVDVRISPLHPDAGEGGGPLSRYVLVTIQDVASRDLIEGRALQTAKMECVGKLAGGLAHRLNNLLTGITGYADLVRARLRGYPDVERDLEQVRGLAGQVQELTAQLLAFGGRQRLSLHTVKLGALVADCFGMLKRVVGDRVDLELAVAADEGSVRVDPRQIRQVLEGLALTARETMPDGGKLTIRTGNMTIERGGGGATAFEQQGPRVGGRFPHLAAGPYVTLEMSDTGRGMDGLALERLFEPFSGAAQAAKGAGLRLAAVHGIIAQHGGGIAARSRPGHGTSFTVCLPREGEAAP